jgi:hypothetical protein
MNERVKATVQVHLPNGVSVWVKGWTQFHDAGAGYHEDVDQECVVYGDEKLKTQIDWDTLTEEQQEIIMDDLLEACAEKLRDVLGE